MQNCKRIPYDPDTEEKFHIAEITGTKLEKVRVIAIIIIANSFLRTFFSRINFSVSLDSVRNKDPSNESPCCI